MDNRLLTVVLILLLAIVVIGGFAVYYLVLEPRTGASFSYQVPEVFMTDLSGRGHVRVEIYLELGEKKLIKEVQQRQVEVIDTVYRRLRSKTREDLNGAQGQDQLRSDLLQDLRQLLDSDQVRNLYFKQIVID